jgi:hypothetical protein
MKMPGNAGASGFPEVHANVEAVGMINLFKGCLSPLGKIHQFIRDLFISFVEAGDVFKGKDH